MNGILVCEQLSRMSQFVVETHARPCFFEVCLIGVLIHKFDFVYLSPLLAILTTLGVAFDVVVEAGSLLLFLEPNRIPVFQLYGYSFGGGWLAYGYQIGKKQRRGVVRIDPLRWYFLYVRLC